MTALAPALIIAALAVIGGGGLLWDRHHREEKKGIGLRIIQFFAVYLLIPSIVILSTTGFLEKQTTATLLGTVVGYILSGIGKDERSSKKRVETAPIPRR